MARGHSYRRRRRSGRVYRVRHTVRLPNGRTVTWDKYTVILLALTLVLAISCVHLLRHGAASRHTKAVNAQVQTLYAQSATEAPQTTAQPQPTAEYAAAATAEVPSPAPQTPAPTEAQSTVKPPYQTIGSRWNIREELQKLYADNSDLVGWLTIPEVVNLPVLYADDNSYYETHDFYGNSSASGSLFLDALHPLAANTQHLVIHGHNMRDGTMFGHLVRYQQKDYLNTHPSITWTTLYAKENYDIFSVAIVSTSRQDVQYLDYLGAITFTSEEQLNRYLDKLRTLSLFWRDANVTTDDALLTLSTCLGDDRILVVGKRRAT